MKNGESKSIRLLTFLNKIIYEFFFLAFSLLHPKLERFDLDLLVKGTVFRIYQLRYFYADYILKKPYKVISCRAEFGPEMKFYVPFAYWHFKNGTLLRTESTESTACLYFFSPRHLEIKGPRIYETSLEVPNSEDHNYRYSRTKWAAVPFKERYRDKGQIKFSSQPLIISNKFTTEWDGPPINFIALETLDLLLSNLTQRYQVIYNCPTGKEIPGDTGSEFVDFEDKPFIAKKYPSVLFAEKLYAEKRDYFKCFNEFQLALYSQCNHYISVQGGNSVLASYFGGKNIVLVKKGRELIFQEYQNFYSKLSGAKVIVAGSEKELVQVVNENYL